MTDVKTKVGRDELRVLCEAATAEPWIDLTDSLGCIYSTGDDQLIEVCRDPEMDDRPDDRAFIAAARTALPAVLDRIDELETAIQKLDHNYGCGECAEEAGMSEYWGPALCGAHVRKLRARVPSDSKRAPKKS